MGESAEDICKKIDEVLDDPEMYDDDEVKPSDKKKKTREELKTLIRKTFVQ